MTAPQYGQSFTWEKAGALLRSAWGNIGSLIQRATYAEVELDFTNNFYLKLAGTQSIGQAVDLMDKTTLEADRLKEHGLISPDFELPVDINDLGAYAASWNLAQTHYSGLAQATMRTPNRW